MNINIGTYTHTHTHTHTHVIFASSHMLPPPTTNTSASALIMRINEITGEQSRLETELANLSRELSGIPVKCQQQHQSTSHQNQDLVDIIDNKSSIIGLTIDKKRSRGRPRKDTGMIVSSSSSNINNIDKHHDKTLRMNCDRDSGIMMNGPGDTDDGAYYFVDCGRVFICNSGGLLFDIKTRELVGWRNTYLNRVDFVNII